MEEEKWIVVGPATVLDTTEQQGALLTRDSAPFVPLKNVKFQKALAASKLAKVRVERKPLMTKEEYLAMKAEARKAESEVVEEPAIEALPETAEAEGGVEVFQEFGLPLKVSKKLVEAGFETLEDLEIAEDDDLLAISGIGASTVAFIREALEG